jgi:signal transduction histidine kinase
LLNAVQAIPGRGRITVSSSADADHIAVGISDTGAGIAPENLGRVFEPGFSTKGSRVGMGLGLLITQQIVEHHGGALSVESVVGVGTTFTVSRPMGASAPPQSAASDPS